MGNLWALFCGPKGCSSYTKAVSHFVFQLLEFEETTLILASFIFRETLKERLLIDIASSAITTSATIAKRTIAKIAKFPG